MAILLIPSWWCPHPLLAGLSFLWMPLGYQRFWWGKWWCRPNFIVKGAQHYCAPLTIKKSILKMIKWEFCIYSDVCWGCAICTTTGRHLSDICYLLSDICYLLSDIWDGTYLTQKSPPLSSGDHLGRGETAANNVPSLTLWNLPTLNIRTVWRVTRLVSIKVFTHFILY